MVVVLIGPGGVGKGTVARRLLQLDERMWLSRSWTTRSPRPGETGTEYFFVTREVFEDAISRNYFYEWAEFHGNLYGTPLPQPPQDHDVLLEIEVDGAQQVRERDPGAAIILLSAPTIALLEQRLRGRGDQEEHIVRRLDSTRREIERGRQLCDYEVVNDDIERASHEILSILEGLRQLRRIPS
ncbi:MAG: guanylate kinase [Acidimicrobiaceae bacterium]|nr:guanylate kinase [Acidimicrobiaceae bacterium]